MDSQHPSSRTHKTSIIKGHRNKNRDYEAEYRRRIELGKERGYSRSQAAGHPNLKIGETGISKNNKTAFPQDITQGSQRTLIMVATSPCVGCTCSGAPEKCRKLDEWLLLK